MIVPEVVVPSLDLPLLHSASYHNPEVHSPLQTTYSRHVHQPRQFINAGTQVTTRTIPSYLGRLLHSQVSVLVGRRSRNVKGQLWIRNVNSEEVSLVIQSEARILGMEMDYHSDIDNS
jgi:hypothetical protein